MNRAQRRAKTKAAKRRNKSGVLSGKFDDSYVVWTNKTKGDNSPEEPKVPGVNVPPEDPVFAEKVANNVWHDHSELKQVIKTISQLSGNETHEDGKWSWGYNSDCKYLDIRIDMRDGGFILSGRGGRINLDQLKWQYKSLKEPKS